MEDITQRDAVPWRVVRSWCWKPLGGMLQVGSRLLEDTYPIPPGAPRAYLQERTLVFAGFFSTLEITLRSRGVPPRRG